MDLDDLGETDRALRCPARCASVIALGELTLDVEPDEIARVLKFLRDDPDCDSRS